MSKEYPGPSVDAVLRALRDPGPADGPTEFSWGPGLTRPGKERATPEDGGMYRGRSPRRGRPTDRDYTAPGNPGKQVRP